METERTPLGRRSVPRYTFLGSGDSPRQRTKTLQCCIAFCLIALLLLTIGVILWYYLDPTSKGSQPVDGMLHLKWPLQEEKYNEVSAGSNDTKRALHAGMNGLREKDIMEETLPVVPIDSPVFRHQIATHTTEEAQKMSRLGYILDMGAREIKRNKPMRWIFTHAQCHRKAGVKCNSSNYRTADGTCNNLINSTWGAALRPFRRILLPKYGDGISEPRSGLPSAREVSLTVHRPNYTSDSNFTIMLAVWGQFIDHDITGTAISRGKNGSVIDCCQTWFGHPDCFPVIVGQFDPFFVEYNVTCMNFVRSAPAPTCSFGPREQFNQVTSFLDGSVVYGNNREIVNGLRTFTGGELKMLKTSLGDLLPVSENPNDGCNRREESERGRYCFLSGDGRSNENLLLTSMHLLFARQHNLLARKLAEINPHWTDEKLFQETRKIVAAQIQHITYEEFLPSVLPETLMRHLNLSARPSGYSQSYDPGVDPTIANVFAAAAFRFGHSLLPALLQQNNDTRKEYVQLHKMLFNPFPLFETEFLENFLKGAMNTSSAKADVHFSAEVTQKLFQRERKGPCGLDLVSLNIQRGRDHGLPPYPDWRFVCGLRRARDFDDLREEFDEDTLVKLKGLYKSVNDLDLYTGGLAEKPVGGGLLGPTISCLIADQFLRLKIGDRFWYETEEEPQRFKPEQLREIRKTSLAEIICRTSGVRESQGKVMRRVGVRNEVQPCEKLSVPDLEAWREANV